MRLRALGILVSVVLAAGVAVWMRSNFATRSSDWEVVDHVADGDTIVLRGGRTVRLVQIDTPEVYFHSECFGKQASAATKELLRRGTRVRLARDPSTSSTDGYGRLLRYVIRRDGVIVNLKLVGVGAAAPYFFDGVRGRYAAVLMRKARAARASGKGLWGRCPGTSLDPGSGVSTGEPGDGAVGRAPRRASS